MKKKNVMIIIFGLFFIKGGITGKVIFSEENVYNQELNLEVKNNSEYLWILENPGSPIPNARV